MHLGITGNTGIISVLPVLMVGEYVKKAATRILSALSLVVSVICAEECTDCMHFCQLNFHHNNYNGLILKPVQTKTFTPRTGGNAASFYGTHWWILYTTRRVSESQEKETTRRCWKSCFKIFGRHKASTKPEASLSCVLLGEDKTVEKAQGSNEQHHKHQYTG